MPPFLRSRLPSWLVARRWTFFDAAMAVALVVFTIQEGVDASNAVWWIFATPLVVALIIRRRSPLAAVILAVTGSMALHLDPDVYLRPIDLAVPLTIYTLTATGRFRTSGWGTGSGRIAWRRALAALAIAVFCVGMSIATQEILKAQRTPEPVYVMENYAKKALLEGRDSVKGFPVPDFGNDLTLPLPTVAERVADGVTRSLSVMLVLALAFAIGDGVHSRRAHVQTLENRASDLEREQRQRIALATAAERARITRELHDVVAHALSVMVVQAQGAAAALRRHPDRTEQALQNVITTGRGSLTEMRRLLDLVRQDPAEDPQRTPQPGIDAIPELIDVVRAAGTPVTLTVEGEPVPVPLTVELFAYRIVQEALTNTIKHSGGTGVSARVRIAYLPDAVEIEVTDTGKGGDPDMAAGNGLRGIAERVAVLGGELSFGPAGPDRPARPGGFRVHATLPLRPKGI
ncbi:MAG TPA: sensor histidine kinase [Candidatus Limnocylindrales bacterium]